MFVFSENNIDMTVPVFTKVEGNKCKTCFWLPESSQENIPESINPEIYIEVKPDLKVFKL